MPNIIVNNYCNQKCDYCFANENMKNSNLQKNMSLETYLLILKYLKINNDNNVRILWWEPLLFPNIRNFLKIANKWNFYSIVFSNLNIDNNLFKKVLTNIKNIRINWNINNINFYTEKEKINIENNISTLIDLNIPIILWYNITNINTNPDYLIYLIEKFKIQNINLKITNSIIGEKLIIDNKDKKLWKYIVDFIKKYHNKVFIEISCWLNKNIFDEEQLNFIKNNTNILLKFWCDWNIWKFDVNTDWKIFKCYPLKKLFTNKKFNIDYLLDNNVKINDFLKIINKWNISKWECIANKKIKNSI